MRIADKTRDELVALGCRPWDESGLMLLPAKLLDEVDEGTELTSIFGAKVVVGRDYIDRDTRFGLLAVGVFPKEPK